MYGVNINKLITILRIGIADIHLHNFRPRVPLCLRLPLSSMLTPLCANYHNKKGNTEIV